jgi:hypothetical protein
MTHEQVKRRAAENIQRLNWFSVPDDSLAAAHIAETEEDFKYLYNREKKGNEEDERVFIDKLIIRVEEMIIGFERDYKLKEMAQDPMSLERYEVFLSWLKNEMRPWVISKSDKADAVISSKLDAFRIFERGLRSLGVLSFDRKWIGSKSEIAEMVSLLITAGVFKGEYKKGQAGRSNLRRWFEERYSVSFDQQFKPDKLGKSKTKGRFLPLIERVFRYRFLE